MGFLKKKEYTSKGDHLDIPLPPKAGEPDSELPRFNEQEQADDLNLPEIPELEQPVSENQELPEFPSQEETEPPMAGDFDSYPGPPTVPEPEIFKPQPQMPKEPGHESMEDAYKYTPAEPRLEYKKIALPELQTGETMPERFSAGAEADVFIKGDDYRDLIESLEMFIRKGKENGAKKERDVFIEEEKEYEKLIKIVEDLQRSLIITDNTIFE